MRSTASSGTLLCAIAASYPMLLVARMVTGLFAGVVGSVSFAIVTDLFPIQMRGRVMGIWALVFGGMTPLGGLEAGALSHFLGVRWTMAIGALVCALAALVVWFIIRRMTATEQSPPA